MEFTVDSAQLAYLLEALRRLGLRDPESLAASFGLRHETSEDLDRRVGVAPMLAFLEAAGLALGDPLVGLHAGSRVEPRGLLYYLLLSIPGLVEGLKAWARFASLPFDGQKMELHRVGDSVEVEVLLSDPALARNATAVDYVVATNVRTLRKVFPGLPLESVSLAHEEIGEPGETARTLGCPVRFSAGRNSIRLPVADAGTLPTSANAIIARQLLKSARALSERLDPPDVETRVSHLIRLLIESGDKPDRVSVAARLGIGERTLQRRLDAEGVSFREIRDRVRLALAQEMLLDARAKVEAISLRLGFADPASFCRAFTRWTGSTPAVYRARAVTA